MESGYFHAFRVQPVEKHRPAGIAKARVFALVVALLLVERGAAAEPTAHRGAQLTWARGEGTGRCVGALGLAEDVKTRLGYDPFRAPVELAIEGVVVREARGFRAELVVRRPDGSVLGTRRLLGREPDCRALGEAIAVAITVAIDPDAPGTRASTDLEAGEEGSTSSAPASPPPAPLVVPSPLARGAARVTLSIGATAGVVPNVPGVVALRVHASASRLWEIGLGAHAWPGSSEGGLGFALTSASLDACASPITTAAALRWCAAAHAGVFYAFVQAPELAPIDAGGAPWAAIETGPSVVVPLVGSFRLDGGVSALVPLVRRVAFVAGRTSPVWEQAAVAPRAEIGVAAVF